MASVMLLMDYHGLFLLKRLQDFFFKIKNVTDFSLLELFFKTTFLFTK